MRDPAKEGVMQKLSVFLQLVPLLFVAVNIHAADISIGKKLPDITIKDLGLMTFDYVVKDGQMVCKKDCEPAYRGWSTAELQGKVSILFHLAARMGTYKMNRDLLYAIAEAGFPDKLPDAPCKVITILNTDDAIWGTSDIARNKFIKLQKKFPHYLHIIDEEGIALQNWSLTEKGSSVLITDKNGTVVFFKEGTLNTTERETALTKIKQLLE